MLASYELDLDISPPLVEFAVDTPLGTVRVWGEALRARGLPETAKGALALALELAADDAA